MKTQPKNTLSDSIKREAAKLGFYSCGISKADQLTDEADRLTAWLTKGFHSGMDYMANHFDKRTDPRKLVENAKSVISVLYNYAPASRIPEKDTYKISCYAYGKDYHIVLKKKLKRLMDFIKKQTGEFQARAFVDSAPVLDRAWAVRSGLGWIGKNTMLITKEQGSYFFIGEIITDLELEYEERTVANYCGGCTRCIDACPTDALKPYELDANKCISNLTIENKKDIIPDEFHGKFHDWIFGCDICQQVCPWNRLSEPNSEPEFEPLKELSDMRKGDWEKLTEENFSRIFRNSPLKRAKFSGLKRNVQFASRQSKGWQTGTK